MSTAPAILVTGGASGIGFAVVEAVLAEGGRAICADVSEHNLTSAREKLGDRSELRFERLDVADEDAVVRAVIACESEFGPLGGVINSAGIARDIPALETSAKIFRQVLDVNLLGSFLVAREAAKAMRGRRAGAIVNLASVSGVVGNQGRTAYGASKGGVIVMTKILAIGVRAAWHSRQCDRAGTDRHADGERDALGESSRGLGRPRSATAVRDACRRREHGGLFTRCTQVRLCDRPDDLRRRRLYCDALEDFRLMPPQLF
jgi:NADP-dependent 3-hydroxy acid dehydrogenase YdfG